MGFFTSNELAIAGIAGTLIGAFGGGAVSYVAQQRSTRALLAAQQRERLWEKRSELYLEIIRFLEDLHGNHGPYMTISLDRFTQIVNSDIDFANRLSLFGSEEVMIVYGQYNEAQLGWLETLALRGGFMDELRQLFRERKTSAGDAKRESVDKRNSASVDVGRASNMVIHAMQRDLSATSG